MRAGAWSRLGRTAVVGCVPTHSAWCTTTRIGQRSIATARSPSGSKAAVMAGAEKISSGHLPRIACTYLCQSTPAQLRNNSESRERQYELVDRAGGAWLAGPAASSGPSSAKTRSPARAGVAVRAADTGARGVRDLDDRGARLRDAGGRHSRRLDGGDPVRARSPIAHSEPVRRRSRSDDRGGVPRAGVTGRRRRPGSRTSSRG